MRSYTLVILFGLALIVLFASSCNRSSIAPTVAILTVATPANTLALSTASQTIPNITSTMTDTSTPAATKETTLIPLPSATASLISTLSAEDARARIVELLSNNGGCQLPCLWGITPGVTTAQQAMSILAPLSSMSDYNIFNTKSGTILLNYGLKENQMLDVFINYLENQDNVYSVSFEARDLIKLVDQQSGENVFQDVFDSPDFGETLDFYMLHQVLDAHGRPTSVLLTTWGKIPSPRYGQGNFKLILLYPEQGIAVQYTTEMRVDGNNIVGCLDNAHVEMDLLPSGHPDTIYEQLTPTDWQNRIASYKPLEEVTSMSIDAFYGTFRQPTDECLVTPADLWPVPER